MKPAAHAGAGLALGAAVLAAGGGAATALTAAAVHVLLDLDHAVEHLVRSDRPFCVRTFLGAHNALTWNRVCFFLHGHEWALTLWAGGWLFPHPLLFAAAAGISTHLLLDEIGNRLDWAPVDISPGFYFFFWRLSRGFLWSRLTTPRPGRTIRGEAGVRGAEP